MSLYYTCRIYLNASFNNETRLTLIKKGKQLGFIYFNLQSYSGTLDIATNMSSEEALNYLFFGETVKRDIYDFPKNLTISYLETIFTLSFYKNEGDIYLYFFVLENPWKKKCNSDEYIDFGRYVKLWIDMCEDFCIYKIETSID